MDEKKLLCPGVLIMFFDYKILLFFSDEFVLPIKLDNIHTLIYLCYQIKLNIDYYCRRWENNLH